MKYKQVAVTTGAGAGSLETKKPYSYREEAQTEVQKALVSYTESMILEESHRFMPKIYRALRENCLWTEGFLRESLKPETPLTWVLAEQCPDGLKRLLVSIAIVKHSPGVSESMLTDKAFKSSLVDVMASTEAGRKALIETLTELIKIDPEYLRIAFQVTDRGARGSVVTTLVQKQRLMGVATEFLAEIKS